MVGQITKAGGTNAIIVPPVIQLKYALVRFRICRTHRHLGL